MPIYDPYLHAEHLVTQLDIERETNTTLRHKLAKCRPLLAELRMLFMQGADYETMIRAFDDRIKELDDG